MKTRKDYNVILKKTENKNKNEKSRVGVPGGELKATHFEVYL